MCNHQQVTYDAPLGPEDSVDGGTRWEHRIIHLGCRREWCVILRRRVAVGGNGWTGDETEADKINWAFDIALPAKLNL